MLYNRLHHGLGSARSAVSNPHALLAVFTAHRKVLT